MTEREGKGRKMKQIGPGILINLHIWLDTNFKKLEKIIGGGRARRKKIQKKANTKQLFLSSEPLKLLMLMSLKSHINWRRNAFAKDIMAHCIVSFLAYFHIRLAMQNLLIFSFLLQHELNLYIHPRLCFHFKNSNKHKTSKTINGITSSEMGEKKQN